jgi:rhodanese-related sulfurtransferase
MRVPGTGRALVAGLVALALWAPLACAEPPAGISQQELLSALESSSPPLVLDVRTPGEFAEGHVPGAINVPYDQVSGRLDEIRAAEGQQLVVYCESGRRAGMAEEVLRGAGYDGVRQLEGNMRAWRENDLPLAR